MTGEEQEQKMDLAQAVEPPKKRVLVIETDGAAVTITKTELTPLEVRAICQMLLKQLGG